jgi:hypothetical protein
MAMACLVFDAQLLMAHLKVLLKNMFLKTRQNDFYEQTRNAPDRHVTQGTRSIKGRKSNERLWTVIATCALQGRSAFNLYPITGYKFFKL